MEEGIAYRSRTMAMATLRGAEARSAGVTASESADWLAILTRGDAEEREKKGKMPIVSEASG